MQFSCLGEPTWGFCEKIGVKTAEFCGTLVLGKVLRSSCPAPFSLKSHLHVFCDTADRLWSSWRESSFCLCCQYFLKLSYNQPPLSSHPLKEGHLSRTSWVSLWLPLSQGRVAQKVEITYYSFILLIFSFLDIPGTWTVPHWACFSDLLVASWCRVLCTLHQQSPVPTGSSQPRFFLCFLR